MLSFLPEWISLVYLSFSEEILRYNLPDSGSIILSSLLMAMAQHCPALPLQLTSASFHSHLVPKFKCLPEILKFPSYSETESIHRKSYLSLVYCLVVYIHIYIYIYNHVFVKFLLHSSPLLFPFLCYLNYGSISFNAKVPSSLGLCPFFITLLCDSFHIFDTIRSLIT